MSTQEAYKKYCKGCKIWLPYEDYSPDLRNSDKLQTRCKKCYSKASRERMSLENYHDYNLRVTYKLSKKQYNLMIEEQKGVCAVCKQKETRTNRKTGKVMSLHVDHDHKTGDVRALLCSKCNLALGHMDESPERIRALADYADWCQSREPNVKIIQLPLIEEEIS